MLIKKLLIKNEKGFVLPIAMMLLAILAIIGITAIVITTMDIKIGKNYQTSEQAFHDAESGINFAMGCIQNCLDDGTLTLPENINGTVSLSMCSRPNGFNFTLSDVTKVDDNRYIFNSTGSSSAGGGAKIKAHFRRGTAINYAAFGDLLIDMKANSKIYSYDSGDFDGGEDEDDLVADDSTTDGDVGSNGTVSIKEGTTIDGDVALGDDGGDPVTEAVYTSTGTPVITGNPGVDVDRENPDPLGILSAGGKYDTKLEEAKAADNPDSLCGDDDGDVECPGGDEGEVCISCPTEYTISLGNGDLRVLTHGDYYFTDIELKNGAELRINCTDGDVNIFLEGGLEAKNGSEINVIGNAADFGIFSNSTDSIVFKHGSDFKGVVYAPNATVEMKNSANFYGAIWAKTVDLKNSAEIWFDVALKDKFRSNEVKLTAWIEEW